MTEMSNNRFMGAVNIINIPNDWKVFGMEEGVLVGVLSR